jgi:alkylated DNA repair dioxygenase AlkB
VTSLRLPFDGDGADEAAPPGFLYRPDFLDEEAERRLFDLMAEIDFQEVRMRGVAARRTVAHFGYTYDYDSWRLVPAEPLPAPLLPLRERCAGLAELPAGELAQALVTCYPPGATIGWHRDAPAFGPKVIGVSLLSECLLVLRKRLDGGRWERYRQPLAPRSAYVLGGAARSVWQHSIPATPSLRYSVTFRSIRRRAAA